MEENNNEVEVEVSDEDLAGFDEAWDEDGESLSNEDAGDESDDGPVTEEDSDEQPEGQPDADHEEQPEETSEDTEEPGAETETANQRFKIKYNGAEEEYDLDQMTTLAQKGRDYDHVREDRDAMRGKYGKYEGFLQKLADKAGVSIEEQIDLTEAMWLMDEEAEKGNSLTEAEALLRVQRNRNTAPEQQEEATQKTDAQREVDRFMATYKGVKYEDIPQEVWDVANQTGDLVMAYTMYEVKKLKSENEKLKKDAQNERNAQRSTGPLKTSGNSKKLDDFDEGWNSEF